MGGTRVQEPGSLKAGGCQVRCTVADQLTDCQVGWTLGTGQDHSLTVEFLGWACAFVLDIWAASLVLLCFCEYSTVEPGWAKAQAGSSREAGPGVKGSLQ